MSSTKAHITIEAGSDFNVPISLRDVNDEALVVTNLTANASMRKYYNATSSWSFGTALANGELTLSMSAAESANIAAGRYVYDIILTNTQANTISRLVEGICTVTPRVTR